MVILSNPYSQLGLRRLRELQTLVFAQKHSLWSTLLYNERKNRTANCCLPGKLMNHIAFGIEQEWMDNERISVYTITDISIVSLISLSDSIIAALSSNSMLHPSMGVLLDISAPKVGIRYLTLTGQNIYKIGLTTIGQQRVHEILTQSNTFRIYVAIVVADSISGKIVSTRTRDTDHEENIIAKLFYGREEGLFWVSYQIRQ
jgi:hypothetical protein